MGMKVMEASHGSNYGFVVFDLVLWSLVKKTRFGRQTRGFLFVRVCHSQGLGTSTGFHRVRDESRTEWSGPGPVQLRPGRTETRIRGSK